MANLKAISADLTGLKIGSLQILRFAGYLGRENTPKHAHWDTVCDCGETRLVRATRLLSQAVTQCTSCAHALGSIKRTASVSLPPSEKKLRNRFGMYISNAKKRKISFELTKEEFSILITSPCSYCGSNEKIGVDRENNTLGYSFQNSVSCCETCNYGKRTMTKERFLAWIERIYIHSIKAT